MLPSFHCNQTVDDCDLIIIIIVVVVSDIYIAQVRKSLCSSGMVSQMRWISYVTSNR